MDLAQHLPKVVIALVLLGGGAVIASKIVGPSSGSAMVNVKVPELSKLAMRGKPLFDENCAQCHGENGSGSESGPPLIHKTYNPGHHDDGSFQRAAKNGVSRHHWSFGNMPAQPQVNEGQMANIIYYVRELQMANGIFYQKHQM